MNPKAQLQAAYAAIDAANAQDPNQEKGSPAELLYGQRMTAAQESFAPDAPDPLMLAARAQHLERWKIARRDYPMDRVGYLKWRTDLKKYHAHRATEILSEAGYGSEVTDRVAFLLEKKKLKKDPDTQTLEDIICLVFLEYYAADFAAKHEDDKVVDILHKTWGKMSEEGRAACLKLDLDPGVRTLVEAALEK